MISNLLHFNEYEGVGFFNLSKKERFNFILKFIFHIFETWLLSSLFMIISLSSAKFYSLPTNTFQLALAVSIFTIIFGLFFAKTILKSIKLLKKTFVPNDGIETFFYFIYLFLTFLSVSQRESFYTNLNAFLLLLLCFACYIICGLSDYWYEYSFKDDKDFDEILVNPTEKSEAAKEIKVVMTDEPPHIVRLYEE